MAERHVEVQAHKERDRWTWTAVAYDGSDKAVMTLRAHRTYKTRRGALSAARVDIRCLGGLARIEVLDG